MPTGERQLPAPELILVPEPSFAENVPTRPGRPHLVVVESRAVSEADGVPQGAVLITRYWHPRDQRWNENHFESIDHALRLFVDESGWSLVQRQQLDQPEAWELIFEARRGDFAQLTDTEMLEVVGLSKERVEKLIAEVDEKK